MTQSTGYKSFVFIGAFETDVTSMEAMALAFTTTDIGFYCVIAVSNYSADVELLGRR